MIRWAGTLAYLVGMVLTSANIYPLNLYFGALGGIFWAFVGVKNKDNALIVVEVAAAMIYIAGLISHYSDWFDNFFLLILRQFS